MRDDDAYMHCGRRPTWLGSGYGRGVVCSPHSTELRPVATTDSYLARHPTRVRPSDAAVADFEIVCCQIVCCLNKLNMRQASELSPRPIDWPYMVWRASSSTGAAIQSSTCATPRPRPRSAASFTRSSPRGRTSSMCDLLDTTQRVNDVRFALPGVAWPPPAFWSGPAFPPARRYQLTFRGGRYRRCQPHRSPRTSCTRSAPLRPTKPAASAQHRSGFLTRRRRASTCSITLRATTRCACAGPHRAWWWTSRIATSS